MQKVGNKPKITNDLETNPLLIYIFIDDFVLYVTYKGQTVTCRFCGETGHVQMNCEKRMLKFPKLGYTFYNQETDNLIKKLKICTNACVKKRCCGKFFLILCFRRAYKLVENTQAFGRTEEIQSVRLFDKACSTPTSQTQQAVICDANEIDLSDSLYAKKSALIILLMRI